MCKSSLDGEQPFIILYKFQYRYSGISGWKVKYDIMYKGFFRYFINHSLSLGIKIMLGQSIDRTKL